MTEHNLLQTLLGDYDKYVRPVRHPSHNLVVSIGVTMRQIIDLVSFWILNDLQ